MDKQPLALFSALLLTSWGHSIPEVCSFFSGALQFMRHLNYICFCPCNLCAFNDLSYSFLCNLYCWQHFTSKYLFIFTDICSLIHILCIASNSCYLKRMTCKSQLFQKYIINNIIDILIMLNNYTIHFSSVNTELTASMSQ